MTPRRSLALIAAALSLAAVQSGRGGGWYVGNTAPGEWIEYKHVWLANGAYRFTARAGATTPGATLQLEIDGAVVKPGVTVPVTARPDAFGLVHLGSKQLAMGYHDLRISFQSAGISLDWFMLRKDADSSPVVKPSDTVMVRPPANAMMLAPIVGFEHKTKTYDVGSSLLDVPEKDEKGRPYTDEQLSTWYSVPMYRDYDRRTDRYWDVLVDELMTARATVPIFHCRETTDFTNGLQDRDYQPGGGAYEGRWLKKLAEAIARNPQAASWLRIGMLWENGGIAKAFAERYGYNPGWGDEAFLNYVMQYWLGPWFEAARGIVYEPTPGRCIISIYHPNPEGIVQDGKMGVFLAGIRDRLKARFGLDPMFVVPNNDWVDAEAKKQAWGQAPWVTWNGPLVEMSSLRGATFGTASSGSRRRIDTVFMNDWDPKTNTGSPGGDAAGSKESHMPRLDAKGNSMFWGALDEARKKGARFIEEEGFTNISEGNGIARSAKLSEWAYPNQHIGVMREFADPATESLMFEAEGCDDYHKVKPTGNLGGTFRRQWYSPTDLDVFRPLHNLQPWEQKAAAPEKLVQLDAGFWDVWALDAKGQGWAQRISGSSEEWLPIKSDQPFTCLSVGKSRAWAIGKDGKVYTAKLANPGATNSQFGWNEAGGGMTQLDVGEHEVWAVNSAGKIFHRREDGEGDWAETDGQLDKVWIGDAFAWGLRSGKIYRRFLDDAKSTWIEVPNPHGLIQLSLGSDEVWGINAAGAVFRRSAAGVGDWEPITGKFDHITVGENYAWAAAGTSTFSRKLEGFRSDDLPAAPMGLQAVSGDGNVALSWIATTGVANYRVQRARTRTGPFETLAMPLDSTFTDLTAANGLTYYYSIAAENARGLGASSAVLAATPAPAPAAPTELSAKPEPGKITLSWKMPAVGRAGVKIERKLGADGVYCEIGRAEKPGVTSFVDGNVLRGVTYGYRLKAFTPADTESAASNEITVQTPGAASIFVNFQPKASAPVSGYFVDGGEVYGERDWGLTYGWKDKPVETRERKGSNQDRLLTTVATVTPDSTWEVDVPNGTYQVKASVGDVNDDTTASLAIEGVTFWDAVKLKPNQFENATKAVQVTDGKLTVTHGGTDGGNTRLNYLEIVPTSAPAAPTGLTAIPGNGQIGLTWDRAPMVDSYILKRANAPGGPYLKGPIITGTSYVNTSLPNGKPFYYTLTAVNPGGESAPSAPAGTTPQPGLAIFALKARINDRYVSARGDAPMIADQKNAGADELFAKVDQGKEKFALRSLSSGKYVTVSETGKPLIANGASVKPDALFTLDTAGENGGIGIKSEGTKKYVSAEDAGKSPLRAERTGIGGWETFDLIPVGVPATPTNLSIRSGGGKFFLSWSPSLGAQRYRIRRSTSKTGPYNDSVLVAGTSISDSGLVQGKTYYYTVAAVGSGGESPATAPSSIAPEPLPATPAGLQVVMENGTTASLKWAPSPGASGYNVKRSASMAGPFTGGVTVKDPQYKDRSLTTGVPTYYTVSAIGTTGQSADTRPAGTAPTAPPAR